MSAGGFLWLCQITGSVWCIGFAPEFGYVDAGRGHSVHVRGVPHQCGLYVLGLGGKPRRSRRGPNAARRWRDACPPCE